MRKFNRLAGTAAVALGVGLASFTAGAGSAAAQPGPGCGLGACQGPVGPGGHNGPAIGGDRSRTGPPPGLAWRGIDQGRIDRQPFNYNGNWVTPVFNPQFNNWGFWLFGLWIPL
ncbi:hypothetical protein [Mycobacterium deserti]|uniref:Uncharacterized protein n=1 Tax=Mycobacterium deserti TaxID=2978347 RepID=A0ABT2MBT8_9MYCO|nr:hypothetical protein [Mycobacterium deserti]MCT7659737.1 hypothetical protein [Mycobacterium deserti]